MLHIFYTTAMTVNIESASRTKTQQASETCWRIRPEPDALRGKERIHPMDISFYWLVRGINSQKLYEPGARLPFAFELSTLKEQAEFGQRLQGTLLLYAKEFVHTQTGSLLPSEKTQTVVGSYRHKTLGKPALVMHEDGDRQKIEHVWVQDNAK